mmetsp:Transcript_94937/g.163793  ORF Transcript_94937/g.163793 Transcript_94937/m.163793 type:complete len:247 (-) Transcript_94937:9618-10358(-)
MAGVTVGDPALDSALASGLWTWGSGMAQTALPVRADGIPRIAHSFASCAADGARARTGGTRTVRVCATLVRGGTAVRRIAPEAKTTFARDTAPAIKGPRAQAPARAIPLGSPRIAPSNAQALPMAWCVTAMACVQMGPMALAVARAMTPTVGQRATCHVLALVLSLASAPFATAKGRVRPGQFQHVTAPHRSSAWIVLVSAQAQIWVHSLHAQATANVTMAPSALASVLVQTSTPPMTAAFPAQVA